MARPRRKEPIQGPYTDAHEYWAIRKQLAQTAKDRRGSKDLTQEEKNLLAYKNRKEWIEEIALREGIPQSIMEAISGVYGLEPMKMQKELAGKVLGEDTFDDTVFELRPTRSKNPALNVLGWVEGIVNAMSTIQKIKKRRGKRSEYEGIMLDVNS